MVSSSIFTGMGFGEATGWVGMFLFKNRTDRIGDRHPLDNSRDLENILFWMQNILEKTRIFKIF